MDKIEIIKKLIADKGVTKQKVAERCGIDNTTLSKILNNKIKYVAESRLDLIIAYLEQVNTNEISLPE